MKLSDELGKEEQLYKSLRAMGEAGNGLERTGTQIP